jgi:hypothetical protein
MTASWPERHRIHVGLLTSRSLSHSVSLKSSPCTHGWCPTTTQLPRLRFLRALAKMCRLLNLMLMLWVKVWSGCLHEQFNEKFIH